jgi:hypothetical protein
MAEVLACRSTVAQAARVHGCSRAALEEACRQAVRAATMTRDHRTCQNCGRRACDVQHRIARGMGGNSDPWIAFGMPNQIAVCRACHSRAEARDTEMHALGFWLERTEDPVAVPVAALTPFGRAARWPLADGTWSTTAPGERAAA